MKKILSSLTLVALAALLSILSVQPAQAAGGILRLGEANRFLTAIEISKATFADGDAQTVWLYNSDNPVDALAATPLTNLPQYRGPLLPIKGGTELTPEIRAEIIRVLEHPGYHILGGTDAISMEVEEEIISIYGENLTEITRIGGEDRFATAVGLGHLMQNAVAPNIPNMYIVNGYAIADALAVAPFAGLQTNFNSPLDKYGSVILFTNRDGAPTATKGYIDGQVGGQITVVGGTAVVSDDVAEELAFRHWGDSSLYSRIDGVNRYHTARIIADMFTVNGTAFVNNGFGIANGLSMADALPAGVLLAQQYMPLLLTDGSGTLQCDTAQYIGDTHEQLLTGYVFGGLSVVTAQEEQQALDLMAGTGPIPLCAH